MGLRGLTAGASFWTGDSGFEFRPVFAVPVRLFSADARYSRRGTEFRAQFVDVSISNADLLNGALTRRIGVDPNLGKGMRGGLLEASYRFFSSPRLGEVGAFVGTGDGIEQEAAEANDIRTPVLWGLRFRRPLLHDGSAATVEDAIRRHTSEARLAREGFERLTDLERTSLLAFLGSL